MKVIWQQRLAHYVDAMIALRAPGETGDITHEERLELFGANRRRRTGRRASWVP